MNLLALGLVRNIILSVYYLASLLDVKKELIMSIKSTMEELVIS